MSARQPKQDTGTVPMSYEALVGLSKKCRELDRERGQDHVCMFGIGAWSKLRAFAEQRLRAPFVADCAIVDTVEMRPSFNVDAMSVMIVPKAMTRKEIPAVFIPLQNELDVEAS